MSAIEAITLLISSGVASGGLGVLKWAIGIERRMNKLEVYNETKNAAA